MKQMKKILIVFLSLITVLSFGILFACETDNGKEESVTPHTHTYSSAWTYNDTYHWHVATCEHTNEIKDKAQHVYVSGVCVCGKEEPESSSVLTKAEFIAVFSRTNFTNVSYIYTIESECSLIYEGDSEPTLTIDDIEIDTKIQSEKARLDFTKNNKIYYYSKIGEDVTYYVNEGDGFVIKHITDPEILSLVPYFPNSMINSICAMGDSNGIMYSLFSYDEEKDAYVYHSEFEFEGDGEQIGFNSVETKLFRVANGKLTYFETTSVTEYVDGTYMNDKTTFTFSDYDETVVQLPEIK